MSRKTKLIKVRARWIAWLGVTAILVSACGPARPEAARSGLTIEEHVLLEAPTLDPLTFTPMADSMEAIHTRHAAERARSFPDNSAMVDGHLGLRVSIGADALTAVEYFESASARDWVSLRRNDAEIYRVDTGMPSPINSLRGLWVYDGHWVLETAEIGLEQVTGTISEDGQVLGKLQGYDETFEFQTMHGRPFYFFRKSGKIGLSYDGHEVGAAYDEIPHYGCCSASELNPRHAQDMTAFFARRSQTWYYVEAGVFR